MTPSKLHLPRIGKENSQHSVNVIHTIVLLTQVRFPSAARDFSPRVNFQRRLSHGVPAPLYAIACINICAHVKDPVVHV